MVRNLTGPSAPILLPHLNDDTQQQHDDGARHRQTDALQPLEPGADTLVTQRADFLMGSETRFGSVNTSHFMVSLIRLLHLITQALLRQYVLLRGWRHNIPAKPAGLLRAADGGECLLGGTLRHRI